ncbi:mucin-19-like isoform X3 [Rhipicephalus sanguineus]|uniref:mucin-19-like isoform X3 n=1 Tax=Rhipicephalus sanguineus TaxID=34632 RepID=UPI0020C4A379|nr:mucin-19-like isoform X3 [Rhipicephalus sanguineus]
MPACPATCERPFGSPCNKPCTAGCDCPPGYVVNPRFPGMCMQISYCHSKCPANSSFQSCVSNCLPKCGQNPPKACDIKCNSKGACVCNKGYAELERDGKKTCVLQKMCPLLMSSKSEHTGGERQPTETPNMPGRVSGQSVVAASPVSTQNISASRGPSVQGARPSGASGAGGLAVAVGTGSTLLLATSGTGGNLINTDTEAGKSERVSTNGTSTLSGPSSVSAGTPGAGGLAFAVGAGGTLSPVTLGTGGNLITTDTEAGKSELVSTNGTSTLSEPSSGSAGTPGAGGLEVAVGAGGNLLPATSETGGNLPKSATEAGKRELVSTNRTTTLSGPSSGAAGTPGPGELAVTAVAESTLPAATSGKDGSVISPATESGGRELVFDNLTNAHGGLSGGGSETPEVVVDATPTAVPSPALPVPIGSPPRFELPDTRHADLSAATSTAQGATSFLSGSLHTSSPTPIRYSGDSLGYSSWFPQTFSPPNYGLTSFDFNTWATP